MTRRFYTSQPVRSPSSAADPPTRPTGMPSPNRPATSPFSPQYLADCLRWHRTYDDGLHALQRQHLANEIHPVAVKGEIQQREARREAAHLNTERWQEAFEDFADEMLWKFERENDKPAEDGTTKRRRRR